MKIQIARRKVCIIMLIYLFLFATVLENYISIFKWFDECFALMAVFFFIKANRYRKYELELILILLLFVVWTLISNVIFHYQNFIVALSDAFLNIKFWGLVAIMS